MEEKTYINPKVGIKNSKVEGKGMFANEDINEGETIIKWGGKFVTENEAKKLAKENSVVIQIDDDLWSVENRKKGKDYFINHSCDSNLWMKDGRTLIAKRKIKKDEEINIDYALFEKENYVAKWECNCGSEKCRKKVTGKDYLLPEIQKRYENHFSPIILKKIKKLQKPRHDNP